MGNEYRRIRNICIYSLALIFVLILLVGLLYARRKGALEWS